MTRPDFIARLAARATGTAPTARPRLPSRFEDARGRDLTVVESEQLAAATPQARATQPPAAHAATPPVALASPVVAPQPADRRPADERATSPGPHAVPVMATTTTPHPGTVQPERGTVEHIERRIETRSERSVVVRAVPVVAAPVRPATPSADRTEAKTAEAEPAVRITIGRVEVRAAPPPVPAVRAPRRPAPKDDGLPLHDYLRGRRSAP